MKIVILPIGHVDMNALRFINRGVKKVFPKTEVGVLKATMSLPQEAYNSDKKQYHSTHILTKMSYYVRKAEAQCVLGVTEADLYVPSLSFVFGEAECLGKVAVISFFRLKPAFYGEPSNSQLFLERASKEALHEIGHTRGLGHCKNPLCVMFSSNALRMTDTKDPKFCERCRREVSRALRKQM